MSCPTLPMPISCGEPASCLRASAWSASSSSYQSIAQPGPRGFSTMCSSFVKPRCWNLNTSFISSLWAVSSQSSEGERYTDTRVFLKLPNAAIWPPATPRQVAETSVSILLVTSWRLVVQQMLQLQVARKVVLYLLQHCNPLHWPLQLAWQ